MKILIALFVALFVVAAAVPDLAPLPRWIIAGAALWAVTIVVILAFMKGVHRVQGLEAV